MDKTSLETSIERDVQEALASIAENEAETIRRLDIERQAAIDHFRRLAEDETNAHIRQEITRLKNKAALERQKIRLQCLEDFITDRVKEVMTGLNQHRRYPSFMINTVVQAAGEIMGPIEVRLAKADLALADSIRSALPSARVVIKEDPSIQWGGCLVIDQAGGRVFNGTMERMYFRHSAVIRRKIAKMLEEQNVETNAQRMP